MTRISMLLLTACLAWTSCLPPAVHAEDRAGQSEIVLRDGTVLVGRVVRMSGRRVAVLTDVLGRLELSSDDILTIDGLPVMDFTPADTDTWAGFNRDPDTNTIMLSPTPETLGAGEMYFRNFELFFLNVGGGLTDDLDFSLGFLFPVSSEVGMIAAGLKYRLVSRTEFPVGIAATVGGTILDESKFGSAAVVAGIGNHHASLNVSVHQGFAEFEEPVNFFMVGGDYQISTGTKFLAEYSTGLASIFGDDDDDDVDGFLNVGVRFFGERSSFSLTGIRPIGVDTGSFIAFPLAMYSRHF